MNIGNIVRIVLKDSHRYTGDIIKIEKDSITIDTGTYFYSPISINNSDIKQTEILK